jgi:hypothetical protein
MRIPWVPALLLASALGLGGCTQCERACRAEANAYDACLRDWGQEWRDLDAEDRDDYREVCTDTWDRYLDSLESAARADELAQCGDLANDLIAADGCDERRTALQAYGSLD